MGFLDSLYTGTAEFGKIQAVMSVVIATLVGLVLIVVAFNLIFGKQPPPPPPPPPPSQNNTKQKNQLKLSNRTVGIIILLIALIIMAVAYFNAYAVFKIKAVAATEGALDGINMITRRI